jgi:hypothetical protein
MTHSRRDFLRVSSLGALTWFTRHAWVAQVDALQRTILDEVGGRNIGVDVGRYVQDGDGTREIYRAGVNQDALRPTASCFKAWVVLYYYTLTPTTAWDDGPGTPLYNVAVNSHNVATGRVIKDVGQYQTFGNDIEKFNDFLLYGMNMVHGIASWGWEGNPLVGFVDERFVPQGERVVTSRGTTHAINNVTSAADSLNGYRELFRRTYAADSDSFSGNIQARRRAALRTMQMLSRGGDGEYESPLERVLGRGVYVGKDGILREGDTTAGRVINDAGFVPQENGVIGLAFFSVGESEFSAMQILEKITTAVYAVENTLTL